ncbi:hypothetical protein CTI12_AA303540 [Artemisia annua]|uniref:DUF8039 domain-containing protein n=1 Tax=Artemisia annua TaxID=35608 RepID=A0A2U1N6G0_ARTAN|nr:hypothetical protein CTI12_AA303540 [Artemisia annua]
MSLLFFGNGVFCGLDYFHNDNNTGGTSNGLKMLMENEPIDIDKDEWGEKQGEIYGRRVDSFLEKKRVVQGKLIMEWFGTYQSVAKGQVYTSRDGILHGLPIEKGFVKVRVDTVEEGCSALL